MLTVRCIAIVCALVCLPATSLFAQQKSPSERVLAARSQYYTPTAAGLKSFQCDAAIDWKQMLTKISGTDVPDDNPTLKYLNTVHLSVTDQLKGAGSLDWNTAASPPDGKEAAVDQIRGGLQQMVAGFLQSWNQYMNGSMVPAPDDTVKVTAAGDGVHMSATAGTMNIDEDFDKNMLLTQALVVSPELKVLAKPTYLTTSDGLVISTVASQVNQPPTAPETDVTFHVDYAKVDSFQIPSRLLIDIKNTASFDIALNACHAGTEDTTKKP